MAGEAAAALTSLSAVQAVLKVLQSYLAMFGYLCPTDTSISTLTSIGSFDVIIVGSGTAGSVLINRLSECSNLTILVLEAGGCMPAESMFPGYFTMQPQSQFDYNFTSVNDGYAEQNAQSNCTGMTAGKMWGGSSSIHHMIAFNGDPHDFYNWASITGNSTFNYTNMLPYFIKSENVQDADIISEYGSFHGTSGPMKYRRQQSSDNDNVTAAFVELGVEYRSDSNNNNTLGIVEPLLGLDGYYRMSGVSAYLQPVMNRSNIYFLSSATVNKVVLDSSGVATGVEFTYSSTTYTLNATKEVILSAGAIRTPQILMLSGVGNSTHLTDMGITTIVNNSYVGENLQDHTSACMLYALESDTSAGGYADPHQFPVPMTCAYISTNSSQSYPSYQVISLLFGRNSSGLLQLCLNTFKYKTSVCQKMYNANINRKVMLAIPNILQPVSVGYIRLNTTSIDDQPLIYLRHLNNNTDLVNLGSYLQNFSAIINTTSFQNMGAEFVDLGLCSAYTSGSAAYWQCYGLAMSNTMWHYCGTCAIGSCSDTSFKVNGASNLRVVDASSMPKITSGNINAGVVGLAERAADVIKTELNLSCSA